MIYHSIKIFLRNFLKQRSYTIINIIGLAIGLSCALLIYLWIQDEKSYDQFHTDLDRIYQVYRETSFNSGEKGVDEIQSGALVQPLVDEYPDIELAASMTWPQNMQLKFGEKSVKKTGFYVDSLFLEIFSFSLIVGESSVALDDPNSIVISENIADIFFGSAENAVGKTLQVLDLNHEFNVTGVVKNAPHNSSIQFDYIIPFRYFAKGKPWVNNWGNTGLVTYAKLVPNAIKEEVDKKIAGLPNSKSEHIGYELFLHPFSKKRLFSELDGSRNASGRITYVYLFSIVAVFVLLIACINFMNLATARATKRSLEVGVKKVVGAKKNALVIQFLVEALFTTVISMVASLIISELLLPQFNELTGKDIDIPYSSPEFLGIIVTLILITTLSAGSYPAFYLSSFNPSAVLKGSKKLQTKSILRKVLVITQFTLSTILIIGTVGIYKQIDYINTKNLGLDKENVVSFSTEKGIYDKADAFKNDLLQIPGVENMSYTSDNPTAVGSATGDPTWAGKNPELDSYFYVLSVDFDFLKTFKIPLADGRDYDPNRLTDSTSYVINQKAAEIMGLNDPIGKELMFWGDTGTIIGIAEDFHINSMHHPIEQLIIRIERYEPETVFIRLAAGNIPTTIGKIEALFKEYSPEYPFEYEFLDEQHTARYRSEIMIGELAKYFSFITIFISCLGLFGLSSYMAEQRTKEIGIRKTMGATIPSLVFLFSKSFMILIGISFLLAIPFGHYVMQLFLDGYAYKVPIGLEVYLFVGILTIFIAWSTIAFQSIKSAMRNPVDVLRYE